jgi:hypothetical protein
VIIYDNIDKSPGGCDFFDACVNKNTPQDKSGYQLDGTPLKKFRNLNPSIQEIDHLLSTRNPENIDVETAFLSRIHVGWRRAILDRLGLGFRTRLAVHDNVAFSFAAFRAFAGVHLEDNRLFEPQDFSNDSVAFDEFRVFRDIGDAVAADFDVAFIIGNKRICP